MLAVADVYLFSKRYLIRNCTKSQAIDRYCVLPRTNIVRFVRAWLICLFILSIFTEREKTAQNQSNYKSWGLKRGHQLLLYFSEKRLEEHFLKVSASVASLTKQLTLFIVPSGDSNRNSPSNRPMSCMNNDGNVFVLFSIICHQYSPSNHPANCLLSSLSPISLASGHFTSFSISFASCFQWNPASSRKLRNLLARSSTRRSELLIKVPLRRVSSSSLKSILGKYWFNRPWEWGRVD